MVASDASAPLPPAVNFHLWEPCNMRCRFCFATFQDVKQTVLPRGHLPRDQALSVVEQLAAAGFDKITFAGGEPTLCPWLGELIELAKRRGLTTMLVTNGSRLLTPGWLDTHSAHLDWVVLSIDSADPRTHERMGRSIAGQAGRALAVDHYMALAAELRRRNVRLKVNTVVTAENADEDMGDLLLALRPERWKVLQVLPIGGQNDGKVEALECVRVDWERTPDGRMTMKEVAGSEFQLKADLVLLAMGFLGPKRGDLIEQAKVELDARGNVLADTVQYQTSREKLFSAGDMRRGQSLVVWAIREGRQAARAVDEFLSGASTLPR